MRIALVLTVVGLCGCIGPQPEIDPPMPDAGPGAPPFVCGPSTCSSGCCEGNRCRAGTLETACGHSGGACNACGANAYCGTGKACEPLDPNRYGSPDAGAVTYGRANDDGPVRTCRYLGGSWVCW